MKVLKKIPKAEFDRELDRYTMEAIVQRSFEKPLKYPKDARDILSRLGLIFTNPYAVSYALTYIAIMGSGDTKKNGVVSQATQLEIAEINKAYSGKGLNYPGKNSSGLFSRDEMLQVRKEVEEAFRLHPEALFDKESTETVQG